MTVEQAPYVPWQPLGLPGCASTARAAVRQRLAVASLGACRAYGSALGCIRFWAVRLVALVGVLIVRGVSTND